MGNVNNGINIISLIIGFIFGCFITCSIKDTSDRDITIIEQDTIYNKEILDSIEYNIIKKDSIIIEYKKRIEYEKEQVLNDDDSSAIERFKSLASE